MVLSIYRFCHFFIVRHVFTCFSIVLICLVVVSCSLRSQDFIGKKIWTAVSIDQTLVQKYNPDADLDLEVEKKIASIPLINTGEDSIGWMKPETWKSMAQILRKQGSLQGTLNEDDVYTLKFLQEMGGS